MVSFTAISQGIILTSIVLFGSSKAAPAAGSKVVDIVPHNNATNASPIKLPPILSDRVSPIKPPAIADRLIESEEKSAELNKKWFSEHGGNYSAIAKRDANTVAGYTLNVPKKAPPKKKAASNSIVTASSAQIVDFKFHAAVASTAYCDTVVPKGNWGCTNCKAYLPDGKLVVTFSTKSNDIGGFILRSDAKKTIYLVFRGTNSYTNWIVNLTFEFAEYAAVKGAKVHKGFYRAYQEAIGYFFKDMQEQIKAYPGYKIVITGHSLGGAQAVLAGMDLYQRINTISADNLSIYTVGAPRIGNPEFAYYVDSTDIPISRSVHNRDIVPHVPPQSFGYLHPGVEAWDKSSGNIQICTANIENDSCSNSIVPFTSISDHRVYYDIKEGTCV
ncbi:unnamed protein product [Mucor hiemalis]